MRLHDTHGLFLLPSIRPSENNDSNVSYLSYHHIVDTPGLIRVINGLSRDRRNALAPYLRFAG